MVCWISSTIFLGGRRVFPPFVRRFSTGAIVGLIGLAGDDQGAHEHEQFSYDGAEGALFGFAVGGEALIDFGHGGLYVMAERAHM